MDACAVVDHRLLPDRVTSTSESPASNASSEVATSAAPSASEAARRLAAARADSSWCWVALTAAAEEAVAKRIFFAGVIETMPDWLLVEMAPGVVTKTSRRENRLPP